MPGMKYDLLINNSLAAGRSAEVGRPLNR